MNVIVYHGSAVAKECLQEHEFWYASTDTGIRLWDNKATSVPMKFNVRRRVLLLSACLAACRLGVV